MVNRRGQTISEFVVVTALLISFGFYLAYHMLSQPEGAVVQMQENVTKKIANDH